MEWNSIETWLIGTVWGIILLSALGSGLLLLGLNLWGRTRKGIEKYWIYSKEGKNKIIEEALKDSNYLESVKTNLLFYCFYSILYMIIWALSITVLGISSLRIAVEDSNPEARTIARIFSLLLGPISLFTVSKALKHFKLLRAIYSRKQKLET